MGTHFWNFEDELLLLGSKGGVVDEYYNHGVLHRAPASEGGARTPRLVAFDTRQGKPGKSTSILLYFVRSKHEHAHTPPENLISVLKVEKKEKKI